MSLRRRDVEQWMSHRRLPEDLRRFHIIEIISFLGIFICTLFSNCLICIMQSQAVSFSLVHFLISFITHMF